MWRTRLYASLLTFAVTAGSVTVRAQVPTNGIAVPPYLSSALTKIRGENILRHVKTLASDEFEGREPGTRGDALTVNYIAREFRRSGLKPGNPDGSYFQAVPLFGYQTVPQIDLIAEGKSVPLKFLDDFVHDVPALKPKVTVETAGIVFAGYGIVAPQFGWDDYKNVDARNKLVIVLGGEPARYDEADSKKADDSFFKGDLRTYYSTRDFKYEQAARRGAAGILVVTDPQKAETFSIFKTFAVMEGMALRSSLNSPLAIAGLITVEAARRVMRTEGRDYETLEKDASRTDFRAVSLAATAKISLSSKIRNIVSRNVIAKLEGSDPRLKNEYVIYSAHWDHLGRDPKLTGDQIYNGANDNAAGTAQLLEVARSFASLAKRPKRSILFIATTAEEKGFLGARYYVQNPLYPISETVAAINLDAGNLFGITKDLGSTGYGNSTLDDVLAAAAEMQGRAFIRASMDNGGFYFASDEIEFAKAGIPAVFPWSGNLYNGRPADFGEKVWDEYVSKRYHQVADEVMPDWDMAGAVEDARWYVLAGFLIATEKTRPSWRVDSEFGRKSSRS